jgi:hypothetical protein
MTVASLRRVSVFVPIMSIAALIQGCNSDSTTSSAPPPAAGAVPPPPPPTKSNPLNPGSNAATDSTLHPK